MRLGSRPFPYDSSAGETPALPGLVPQQRSAAQRQNLYLVLDLDLVVVVHVVVDVDVVVVVVVGRQPADGARSGVIANGLQCRRDSGGPRAPSAWSPTGASRLAPFSLRRIGRPDAGGPRISAATAIRSPAAEP